MHQSVSIDTATCSVYNSVIKHWNGVSTGVLSRIVYATNTLRAAWHYLLQSEYMDLLLKSGSNGAESTATYVHFQATLALFARSYSHLLFTLDDREFFELQEYFKLKELVAMVTILKQLLIKPIAHKGYSLTADLSSTLHTLLEQLYDRKYRYAVMLFVVTCLTVRDMHLQSQKCG
jgi:hypothetical protein